MSVGIDELAHTLGALRWTELRWFEVLGDWMRSETEPATKVAFALSCQRRAGHAELLAARLPSYGIGAQAITPDTVTTGPGPFAPGGADAHGTPERLSAFYRTGLSRLLVEYGALLRATDARTDGPTHRLLSSITADEAAELAAADALLRRFGVSDG